MKSEYYSEECCEYCGDVIHNHFDCPKCKKDYAGTSVYGQSMYEFFQDDWEDEKEFSCEECKAKFKLTGFDVDLFMLLEEVRDAE